MESRKEAPTTSEAFQHEEMFLKVENATNFLLSFDKEIEEEQKIALRRITGNLGIQ